MNRLTNSINSLIHDAPALSQRFSRLPDNAGGRSSCSTAIEHAKREHTKRYVDQTFLQVIPRAEGCFKRIAKLIFSGFRYVVE